MGNNAQTFFRRSTVTHCPLEIADNFNLGILSLFISVG